MDMGIIHCQHQDTFPSCLAVSFPRRVFDDFTGDYRVNLVKWFVGVLIRYPLCFVDLNLLLEVAKVRAAYLSQTVHLEQAVLRPVKYMQIELCRIGVFLLVARPTAGE